MSFNLKNTNGKARRGELKTAHGTLQTPFFMTVGTQAVIKGGLTAQDIEDLKGQIILSNTYHLHLRPGEGIIKKMGGLHGFMNWDKPTLTDSGGFQVFSLAEIRKINEKGVEFKSHLNGEKIFISPEKSIQIQNDLGADIIMAFDECTPYPCTYEYAEKSLEITHKWEERSLKAHKNKKQQIFAIVQGSVYEDLRIKSAQFLSKLDFNGYAIGGLAVGEPAEEMYKMIEAVEPHLPENKPRYLMGVGTPENILEAVERGIDMFDCVMPTRNARHGSLFTKNGMLRIKNAKYKEDNAPIETDCTCPTCQNYSRAYLRHLFSAGEISAMRLATLHNIHFYLELTRNIRKSLEENNFSEFKKEFLARFKTKI